MKTFNSSVSWYLVGIYFSQIVSCLNTTYLYTICPFHANSIIYLDELLDFLFFSLTDVYFCFKFKYSIFVLFLFYFIHLSILLAGLAGHSFPLNCCSSKNIFLSVLFLFSTNPKIILKKI